MKVCLELEGVHGYKPPKTSRIRRKEVLFLFNKIWLLKILRQKEHEIQLYLTDF
jgi:hypothetical protein